MDASKPPRIAPLDPPYSAEVSEMLAKWMPPGAAIEPLKLFRTLAHNMEFAGCMLLMGARILGRKSLIDPRDREILIDRVCAQCGCEYEWGVHAVSFGNALGIPPEVLQATVTKPPSDPVWGERDALLVRLADELHQTSHVSDGLWGELARLWTAPQLIELVVIVGWYSLISFLINAVRVPLEDWALRFPPE